MVTYGPMCFIGGIPLAINLPFLRKKWWFKITYLSWDGTFFSESFVLSSLLSEFHLESPYSWEKERNVTASLEGLDLTVLSRTVGGGRVHEMRLARDSRLVVGGGPGPSSSHPAPACT